MVEPKEIKKSAAEVRREKSAAGRKKREAYNKIKQSVLEYEKENYTKLFVMKSSGDWYKLLGHSAVIYSAILAPRLGKTARLLPDTDYHHNSKEGTVSIRNIGTFKSDMETLGVELIYEKDEGLAFRLGFRVEPEMLNNLIKQGEMERKQVQKLLMPEVMLPQLKMRLFETMKLMYFGAQNLSPLGRAVIGEEMAILICKFGQDFIMMANGFIDRDQYFTDLSQGLQRLKAGMAVVSELRLMKDQKIFQILEALGKTEQELIKASQEVAEDEKKKGAETVKAVKAKAKNVKEAA